MSCLKVFAYSGLGPNIIIVQRSYNVAKWFVMCRTTVSRSQNILIRSFKSLKSRAPVLQVHTKLHDVRTTVVWPKRDNRDCKRSSLNFKHAQNSDATVCDKKNTCNECDRSCNKSDWSCIPCKEGDRSCNVNKTRSQSVLRRSCANYCERDLSCILKYNIFSIHNVKNTAGPSIREEKVLRKSLTSQFSYTNHRVFIARL